MMMPKEGFFGPLKNEPGQRTRFRSRREVRAALFEDVAIFHNRRRCHSSSGDRTSEQARIDMTDEMAAE
ncbi:IS3 family transposase [Rhodovulum sulfidophilum]|uniref:IS3 family transposase n=1 Tax=Rhodovulum sulfidophilum TaxID=35806 RepID=A0ABS1RT67_RHOSU|nr:IS3 family transposase [Rhodovulum sulfidophilum]MBL3609103.1 IS3 family transposase [Rhodovulum sulfidophilum]MCE8455394.1 IS3 family transposase [Rhodovulum sulfidophilum]